MANAQTPLSPPIAALAGSPGEATLSSVWRALPDEDKVRAVASASEILGLPFLQWIRHEVARVRHFREQTVRGWPADRLHAEAARLNLRSPAQLQDLIVSFHRRERAGLLRDYLAALRVEHDDGLARAETEITEQDAEKAARTLLTRFPTDHVVVYLTALAVISPWLVPGVGRWLPERVRELDGAGPSPVVQVEADGEEGEGSVGAQAPEETDEFTTLDQQLVKAIVASAQGVEGSLDQDRIQDLIDEVIALNDSRHRSFFHRGFADVVLGLEPREHLPAENASRLHWYWSGYIHGLARERRWSEIVRHFEAQPSIGALGRQPGGASSTTAPLVFQALAAEDRPGEASAFLSASVLATDPGLLDMVGQQVRRLIWEDRAADARGLTDLLTEAVEHLVALGHPPHSRRFLEFRRRRAHCLRQLGELEEARELLEELLEHESDQGIRGMVLTDLGLVDAGFRSLAEVRLPLTEERLSSLREDLERGEARFRESAAVDSKYSAHGRYCLGVLDLCRAEWEHAARHLDVALSLFESQRIRYEAGGLVEHARVCLGCALALALAISRAPRAVELLAGAAAEGGQLPRYWLADVIEGLHLASDELAQEVVDAVLDADPELLDELLDSEASRRSRTLATALLDRSGDPARGQTQRAADLRRVLPLLLGQERLENASLVLDRLESEARAGIGVSAFVDLLAVPESYEPAWEASDALWARVQILGSNGERAAAIPLLEGEFWRALHSDRFGWEEESEGILEAIREFGGAPRDLEPLRTALQQKAGGEREAFVPGLRKGEVIRVLVVGGDERQARYADEVKEEIQANHPGIRVAFIRPGWGSNWAGDLDEVKRRLPEQDAVVILRFMRTEFGKQLRRSLDVPWHGCAGAGRTRMVRSILLAAEMGRQTKGSTRA